MNREELVNSVRDLIPSRACLYEGLEEEAIELSKERLKMARLLRCENYSPALPEDVEHNITEEYTDLLNVSEVLGLQPCPQIADMKMTRWIKRLKRAGGV